MASDTRTSQPMAKKRRVVPTMPYVYEDYVAHDGNAVRDVLAARGVAIVPGVLDAAKCSAVAAGVWDTVENATADLAPPAAAPGAPRWPG